MFSDRYASRLHCATANVELSHHCGSIPQQLIILSSLLETNLLTSMWGAVMPVILLAFKNKPLKRCNHFAYDVA
jgi:hypothetical protein